MTNNSQSLPKVLNGRRFVVPDYQRPYAWKKRQLEDLWQDIDLMTDRAKHYTGTLVLKELDEEVVTDSGDTLVTCEVVDGQQRLTTCLLILHELRVALGRIDHELALERAHNLETNYGRLIVGGLPQARLQLGADLNHYWLHVILGGEQQAKQSLTEGEKRLRDAQTYFREQLNNLVRDRDPADSLQVLQRLQTRLTNGLQFLIYEIEPDSHAGEIFETLNDRGRELTDLEKIKNYLLFLANYSSAGARKALADEINRAWSSTYDLLARFSANEDTLLRSHWLCVYQPMAKHWQGSASVKERFAREQYISGTARLTSREVGDDPGAGQRLPADVTSYVRSLEQCAMFTAEFYSREAEYQSFSDRNDAAAARLSAARLRRTGTTAAFRPLVFAARLKCPTDGSFYVRLLDACERYAARVFVIGQRRSNSGQARLYRLAHDLYRGFQGPEEVLKEISRLTWHYADDEVVRSGLTSSQNWYWRAGHKYFLYEYELSLASRIDDVPPFETFSQGAKKGRTTEHILPQKPKWDSGDWSSFTEEQHAELLHGIGNLVLTDDNSTYGNRSFSRKKGASTLEKPCYATSRLAQERELSQLEDWTPDAIENRRKRLAAWALERWHVDPLKDAPDEDPDSEETEAPEGLLPEDSIEE
ncbi:MAG: DUF262 domain-containing protein [Dietzia psychralcaliphila]